MTPAEAQLAFGSEFVAFLAAAATLAIIVLRAGRGVASGAAPAVPPRARPIGELAASGVGLGLVALGAAGFVAGARFVDDLAAPAIAVPRGGGAVLLAASAAWWGASIVARAGAWACAGLSVAAVVVAAVGPPTLAHLVAGLAGLALLVPIADLARASIAARIAASGAATLLVLLLVLSVALSSVLDSNLRGEAIRRLEVRAKAESTGVNATVVSAVQSGVFLTNGLRADPGIDRLSAASAAGRVDTPLSVRISDLSRAFQGRAYLFSSPTGVVVGQAFTEQLALDAAGLNALSGARIVISTDCANRAQAAIERIGSRAFVVSVTAACSDLQTFAGRLVAVIPLDDAYLKGRRGAEDPADAVALGLYRIEPTGAGSAVLAADGAQPRLDRTRSLVTSAADGTEPSGTVADRFVAVAPVRERRGAQPTIAVVASSPTASIAATRDRLFQVLFAIALGGTLLALLVAALVGERIGQRLRRLTVAADAVARGEPGVQAEVAGIDEVGTLGATFDGMARSIDEKTAAEAGLRGRIEAVVAEMGEALVAVDADGVITDWNRAAEDLVGVHASKAVGRPALEVVELTSDEGVDLTRRLAAPPRQRWSATGQLVPVEGRPVPVAASGGTLRDADGEPAGAVVVLRDLRGEREVERMKSEFLSRVGHELRTPLTGVLGYAEMLQRREWPPERVHVMVGEIATSGRRLERIVRMLEFFASSAAGRSQLRLSRIEPRSIVDAVIARWEPQIHPPLGLARRVKRGLPRIEADPQWLAMALGELVDNARKFSPAGGRILVAASATDDGRVELAVTDRGVGLTADQIAQAFEAFSQGDGSDTRRFEGLGLGLSLVQSIAEGHGGEVHIASTPGRGTRISLVLPVARELART